ncbi:unnamed protein product [Rotaria sp. Silwood2]|nr:unnamed protein product [Rotaria sp. Silwood2]
MSRLLGSSSTSSKSSYISDVTDHGSGSSTGHKPSQIANKWLTLKFGRKEEIPFPRNSLLIKENDKKEIRCPASDQLVCNAKFPDSLNRLNIVEIFAHLYEFHPPIYTSITENYDTWYGTKQEIIASHQEIATTQDYIRFFEDAAKKETKSLSSSSTTIKRRSIVTLESSADRTKKSLEHHEIFDDLANKTHDAIKTYSKGNITHNQLLMKIKILNDDYLKN